MSITRTPIIDDDGTGTTGTVIDNAWKQELYDQIDGITGGAAGWQAYTPSWNNVGGLPPPAIGNGSIAGTFLTVGGLTYFEILMVFGSTTTYGTGSWAFGLPVPAVASAPYRGFVAVSGRAYDQSTGGSILLGGGVPVATAGVELYAANGAVSAVVPVTFAAGDQIQVSGTYRST